MHIGSSMSDARNSNALASDALRMQRMATYPRPLNRAQNYGWCVCHRQKNREIHRTAQHVLFDQMDEDAVTQEPTREVGVTGGGNDDNPVQEVCLFSDEEDGELNKVLTDLDICDVKG